MSFYIVIKNYIGKITTSIVDVDRGGKVIIIKQTKQLFCN